jgi:hypothetical protein
MSRALMVLVLVLAAGVALLPALAGEEASEVVVQKAGASADVCGGEGVAVIPGVDGESLEIERGMVEMMTPCPDWTCTKHLQCGYECGGVHPSCNNPTGGICTGTCVCP